MLKFIIFLFLDVVAFSGVLVATLPFVINNFGGSVLLITVAFGLFSFFQFFVSPFWGNLSDKVGRKPLLILNCIAELIANILLAIATSLPIIFLARVVAGLFKTNISVGTAYIADITDEKNRAKGMGMFGVAFGLGFTFGPLAGGLIAGSDYTQETLSLVAWLASAINLLNLIFVIIFFKETLPKEKNIQAKNNNLFKQIEVIKNPLLLPYFLLIFFIYAAFSGMEGTIAVWTKETFTWGPKEVGFVMLLAGFCQIIVQGILLRILIKRFDEIKLIASGFVSLIFGFSLIPTENIYLIPVAIIFLSYGIGISNPCINSILSKKSENNKGLVLGTGYSCQAAARFIGQPLAGFIFLNFGKNVPFYFDAAFLVVVAIGYVFLFKNIRKQA
ncbi:MAG: MFS transporter [Pelagibacteraceae bacterium]|jgi:MFS family permease|nr:MFS transporter [Pelagibacteraceae bacterium]|tara:strand:- start:1378 stop:2541 length:1164 start_codon:yes stop_codon:yes gene_type:complete